MKATNEYFYRFLEGADKRFMIPVYQRNYDWKQEHCEKLFDDLISIIKGTQESYFMGSIVSIIADGHGSEQVIIDGQQRITTLSILLLAIYHLLDRGEVNSEANNRQEEIYEIYLVDKYADSQAKKMRLKPAKSDNDAFEKLFEKDEEQHIKGSNITDNYKYFEERIKETVNEGDYTITIDDIFAAFKKLTIVDIKLDRENDKPQLVFESINSTGKALEQSDLIRNFILMDKEPKDQDRLYEDYWHPIEKNTDYKVSEFARDYLTYRSGKTSRQDKVYEDFKTFVRREYEKDETKLEELLEELERFSGYYKQILSSDAGNKSINTSLQRINHLEVRVSYPYLLNMFHAWQHDKIIRDEDVKEILTHIESFIFRRIICEVPTNALKNIFAALGKNISRAENPDKYLEIFKYYLIQGTGNSRFPPDAEFSDKLKERDIYNLKSKNRIHLFERLENFDNRERVDFEGLREDKKLTIEHIMPQKLNNQWEKDLGENYETIHEAYLHTLGNLTLTGYNSHMQDKPFLDKRDAEKGFAESRLWLNQSLKNLEQWTEDEINSRAEKLAERAIKVWAAPPDSTYQPKERETGTYSIEDDVNFTGTKPVEITFLDETREVKSWKDLYIKTCKLLDNLHPSYFDRLIQQRETATIVNTQPAAFRTPEELRDGIYLETHLSADGIISNLKNFFADNKLDEDDFQIKIPKHADDDGTLDI